MPDVLQLGTVPPSIQVPLTTGSDYTVSLDYEIADGTLANWPTGSVVSMVFANGTTWTATISGSAATFAVDKAVADVMPAGTKVKVLYVNGSSDTVLYVGRVGRFDG